MHQEMDNTKNSKSRLY